MRNSYINRASQSILWLALLLFWGCSQEQKPAGDVLATVGDRIITTQDFIRRAEYTLRPDFCAGDNYIHRKIILNSLIAEKLMALEAQETSILNQDSIFQAYLVGRQEQAMRQWLYKVEAADRVQIDTSEMKQYFKVAGRTIDVAFFQLRGAAEIPMFQNAMDDGLEFDAIYKGLTGNDTIPKKSIKWFDREEDTIRDALFKSEIWKNAIVGPLELRDGSVIVMQVQGWIDQPVITDTQMKQRWADVSERLHERKSKAIYQDLVADIMTGKQMKLNEAVFMPYALAAAEQYLKTEEEKKAQLNQGIWDVEEHLESKPIEAFPDVQKSETLLTLDGEDWSVLDFERALRKHPLVFRERSMGKSDFPEQMKYAIADLIRDHFVTEYAYDKKLDQVSSVRQNVNQFKDHYTSRQLRNDYLESVVPDSLREGISEARLLKNYLNVYVDSLQSRYSDMVSIDMDKFEKIELTHTPMMVSQRDVPYPLIVPAFPRLTTDSRVDYGSLQSQKK